MKPLQERIKLLNLERKELEQDLCVTMEVNNLQQAELPNKSEVIEYTCKQAALPITQKTIKDKMISFFESGPGSEIQYNSKDSKQKGLELHNYIYGKDFIETLRFPGATSSANIFGAIVIDILDYANTSKYKTARLLGGADQNGSGEVWSHSGNWRNTTAISSIKLLEAVTGNFVQYSHFALYGIKGA